MPVPPLPVAERRPLTRVHHGDEVVDRYEWLRDRDDPAVIAHLEAENAYTDARLAPLAPLRSAIYGEIKSRTKETDLSVPSREGDWWYFSRTEEGKQYARHCRAPIAGPDDWTPPTLGDEVPGEQVLLDDDVEARGHDFYSLGSFDVSPDGRLLLWAVDTVGDERYVLHVKDLGSGAVLPDVIEGTMPGALFDADGTGIYYTTCDEAWRPDTVWRHALGGDGEDEQVFTEPDERYWVGVGMTRSRRYVEIGVGSKITSESLLLDTREPEAGFRLVWPRREGVEYSVEHAVLDGRDRLLILHNDGAEDFELVAVDPLAPQGEREVLLASRPGVRLEDVDAFERFVAVSYREGGLARVGLLEGTAIDEIRFEEPLFTAGIGSNPEWAQPTLRIGYGSLLTPSTVFDLTVSSTGGATGERTVLKQQPVLGGYDPADYRERREWAVAEDGTRVPISIVGRADVLERRSPAPMLLYGYGSYEASIDPSFSIARLSMLDRGALFAIAHVRGGGEMGRHWYEQGKTLSKRNTFTDFVAAARHLVETGWTEPSRLVAEGASAGGLLMGAVANLAPELFAGIHAGVPFVDPLTSILDPSLPLTVIEWDEWGDPLHDPAVYAYMKSYSPVENVGDHPYPRILATTSLNDTRVLYVEPAKWVARLREVGADVLLKTEMSAGHGGVSGRYAAWEERAFELAWILDVLGLADAPARA
ncbi:S9 family peptidase [Amnibacterium setariae]|uniref:S9 family peptidase n=1 Tax=Amnibacterium setariae TaxID=2306585 RepID=A0A3A1U545_9MICO|nr:S9 family peptidase [Amnibacterium setariae]